MATGLGLATFASGVTLLSILPISMNQFAVDRAGLTMTLLSPLSARQILAGKADWLRAHRDAHRRLRVF